MRVVWPRKQGRGRGGILTFSKLSVQVIKLKEKHFFPRSCQFPIFPAGFPQLLVISQNIGGQLQVHMDWPSPLKNKGVFFVKREKVPLPDQMSELLNWMCCGDIHPNPLGFTFHIVNQMLRATVQISFVALWRRSTIPYSHVTTT